MTQDVQEEWLTKVVPWLMDDPECRPDCPGGPCRVPKPDAPFGRFARMYPSYYAKTLVNGRYKRGTVPLHTTSLALSIGITPSDIPTVSSPASGSKRLVVRHLCGNPLCCNPAHLAHGLMSDNMADRAVHRSRNVLGHRALTEDEHREVIRLVQSGMLQREVAARFGISQPSVSYIVNRGLARIAWRDRWAKTELIHGGVSLDPCGPGLTKAFSPKA